MTQATCRVVLWGLGAMGLGVARQLVTTPNIEIVGAISHQDGEDLGSVLGGDPMGLIIRSDRNALPERERAGDICIICTASRLAEVHDQIIWALDKGMNVITSAEELAFPLAADENLTKAIHARALDAGHSVFGTGINPGYVMDCLPISLSGPCLEVHHLLVRRINDLSPYGPSVLAMFGVGLTPQAFEAGRSDGSIVGHTGFAQSIGLIAQAMHADVDKVTEEITPIVAQARRTRASGPPVEPGTIAGVLHVASAFSNGVEIIRLEHPQQVDPAAEDLGTCDEIIITGNPTISLRVEPEIPGGIGTIAMIVNAVETVLAAPAGIVTANDLPMIASRIVPQERL